MSNPCFLRWFRRRGNGLVMGMGCLGLDCLAGSWQGGMVARMGEKATILQGLVDGAVDGAVDGFVGGMIGGV